jgi:hypothetical protein
VTGPVEWMVLSAAMRFPSSVTGPRDLAPFAREAAMRNFELTAELWQMILAMVGVEFQKCLDLLRILLVEFCDWDFQARHYVTVAFICLTLGIANELDSRTIARTGSGTESAGPKYMASRSSSGLWS